MNRTQFYKTVTVDNTIEFDYLDNNLSYFRMNYPVGQYLVTSKDLLRPDLISYTVYNSVEYWWIICYVNQILNPFTDLIPGMKLTIPSMYDLYAFLKKYKRR